MTDRRDRSVARAARETSPPSPAEEIRALLAELHDHVETTEKIPRYRGVLRGVGKVVPVLDWAVHRVRAPGLLAQLGIIAAPGHRHGVVIPGAAIPSGSPAWDEDGALAILAAGGSAEAPEPVTEAWHIAAEIEADLDELHAELADEGRTGSLVDIALDDEDTGARIAARLRTLVARARVAAAYDAPVVTLRDMVCRYCGGPLRVRTDASSAVWCAGRVPLVGPAPPDDPDAVPYGWMACGARWPRGSWVRLLEEATADQPPRAS